MKKPTAKKPTEARPIKNPALKTLVLGVASGLGLGYVPFAPGTAGSLLGIPVGLLLLQTPPVTAIVICAVLFAIFTQFADRAGFHWGDRDSGRIVIDEVLGQAIAMLGLRSVMPTVSTWQWACYVGLSFLLFRIFDIFKPFPARTFDRQATGFGVMADDVVAGLYAALIVRGVARIWSS